MQLRVTIDRFEGKFAVCEADDLTMINIPRFDIPDDAAEGDILVRERADQPWRIAKEETEDRLKAMQDKLNSLFDD